MALKNLSEAYRCIEVCARYFVERDESPRAADDLRQAVHMVAEDAFKRGRTSRNVRTPHRDE